MKILSAEFIVSAAGPKQFPKNGKPQIAFAGRSNVGKSSLINTLLHRKNLVKVSSTPGKTQLINFFLVNDRLYFVDLPGYGYARAPKPVVDLWAPMIEGYLKNSPDISAVVVLLDARREPDARDVRLLEWLRHYGLNAVYVLTKADKLNRRDLHKAERDICAKLGIPGGVILTSAKKGQGMDELWRAITKRLQQD